MTNSWWHKERSNLSHGADETQSNKTEGPKVDFKRRDYTLTIKHVVKGHTSTLHYCPRFVHNGDVVCATTTLHVIALSWLVAKQ